MSVGARYFEPEVTVKGFFGFGIGFTEAGWSGNGENRCVTQEDFQDAPCLNVDKGISESDYIGRVNLTWSFSDDALAYFTWSEGYRPGGINRNPFAGDYTSDFLTNWELGWKSEFAGNRMQFNGAVFLEDWEDFQVSFQGANGITQVGNGPSAEIIGTEVQLLWLATDNLRLELSAAYYDSELKDDYADFDFNGNVTGIQAPKGTQLPITPDFKGNLVARYGFDLGSFDAHFQGAFVYSGSHSTLLNVEDNGVFGDVPSSSYLDLSAGIGKNSWALELFVKNVMDEDTALGFGSECTPQVCGANQAYGARYLPRTIGLKFSQEF
jgi:outer membrane receptor protein involved in Fe transport